MGKNGITYPTGIIGLPLSQVSVFASRFTVNPQTGCWEWQGKLTPRGYGMYHLRPRMVRAHRAIYELVTGKTINPKLVIDHLCRVRHCVNPKHLEVVTNKENILRGQGKTALNARKTHCKHGHDMSPDNVYINHLGGRLCKRCSYLNTKNRRNRLRQAVQAGTADPATLLQYEKNCGNYYREGL